MGPNDFDVDAITSSEFIMFNRHMFDVVAREEVIGHIEDRDVG